MIKNLIFDFGKVLIDYDYEAFLKGIIANSKERTEFKAVFCSLEFTNLCDRGDTPFGDIIKKYQSLYPRWKNELQQFGDRQLDAMTAEVPGMRAILNRLRACGYHLYGLTNWSATVYPVIEKFDILQMMDGTMISSEEHLIKPDKAIYERLCEKFGLRMDECLFTDDKQINVDGAFASGMDAVLFKNAAQYEDELKTRNLL